MAYELKDTNINSTAYTNKILTNMLEILEEINSKLTPINGIIEVEKKSLDEMSRSEIMKTISSLGTDDKPFGYTKWKTERMREWLKERETND